MKGNWKYFDKVTFFVLITITLFGIVLIYSAANTSAPDAWYRQAIWLGLSLVAFSLVFRIKTETLFKFRFIFLAGLIVVLIAQLLVGIVISGTKSWIKIGFFSMQLSEFVKIALALICAKILSSTEIVDWKSFMKLSAAIAIPFVLIALQPDLGTASILISILFISFLLKRFRVSIVIFLITALSFGSLMVWSHVLRPYQKDRIISFLSPHKYSQSIGYQTIQSKIAMGAGGLTGKGYLKGSQSQYQFLPTRHTDFIVSVLGEEFGFLGISILFFLFLVLFYRQYNIRTRTDAEFYFVYLFNSLILCQFLVNVLMSIGFFPVLGVPLPFVSYGGSSLLAFYVGEAIILKAKRNFYHHEI